MNNPELVESATIATISESEVEEFELSELLPKAKQGILESERNV